MNRSYYRGTIVFAFIFSFFLSISYLSNQTHSSKPLLSAASLITELDIPFGDVASAKPKTKEVSTKTAYSAAHHSILIYHTHNRESWFPELTSKNQDIQPFDSKINVTLLGSRLMNKLKSDGLDVIHSTEDYASQTANFNYARSYQYSKKTVNEEMSLHPDVRFLFDIHRDSEARDKTTISFNNLNYA